MMNTKAKSRPSESWILEGIMTTVAAGPANTGLEERLNIAPMLTHEFAWHELPDVYRRLDEGDKSIVGTTIRWDA